MAEGQRGRAEHDATHAAHRAPVTAYVGLGANLGDAAATLVRALDDIASIASSILESTSSFYRSAPVDSSGPDYVNAVARVTTRLSPHDLLHALQRIENRHGRERSLRNAPRTLDLDLLLYGDAVVVSEELTLPHPRLHERAFVLRPLADVAAPGLSIGERGDLRSLLSSVRGQRADRL